MTKTEATTILNQEDAGTLRHLFNDFVKPFDGRATPRTKAALIMDVVDHADAFGLWEEMWEAAREATTTTMANTHTSRDYRQMFAAE